MAILERVRWYLIVFKIQIPVTLSKDLSRDLQRDCKICDFPKALAMLTEVAEGVAL